MLRVSNNASAAHTINLCGPTNFGIHKATSEQGATLNATNLTGAAGHGSRGRPHVSPVLALLICGSFLFVVWPSFVRLLKHTHAHLPLRRHLGGRGHYVALAQAEP